MPVTTFQKTIARLLASNRSEDSYLAGAAALHFEPNSIRYSNDLDYFHDSEVRVSTAFAADSKALQDAGIGLKVEIRQPGYIRAVARGGKEGTKIEWAHDSAWRFLPTVYHEGRGFCLQPLDLAINKTLALAGRDEARDFLDVMHAHQTILPLAGLVWAACGKDPGFNPRSLLELLRRKGKYQPEDFRRLHLNIEIEQQRLKQEWLEALESTATVIAYLPAAQVGCLYYNVDRRTFEVPRKDSVTEFVPHYATEGGVLPKVTPQDSG